MRVDNHFVPKVYLRSWGSAYARVWVYRLLVSSESVPLWKLHSIRGLTKRQHLYTSALAGKESDRIEAWLDRDFEAPASEPIRRVLADQPLTKTDWRCLVNFVAAQDVRTPVRFMQHMEMWSERMPSLLRRTVDDAVARLEEDRRGGVPVATNSSAQLGLPVRVTTRIEPGAAYGELHAAVVVGRETWLFGIERLLSKTIQALHEHKWTILRPAAGKSWITSDNPVIKLNYHGSDQFDFGGGWGRVGSEIMLPLGPQHLLYARVGYEPPPKGAVISGSMTDELRRLIALHAHRLVIAHGQDPEVVNLRTRVVDAAMVRSEQDMWAAWHSEQSAAVARF